MNRISILPVTRNTPTIPFYQDLFRVVEVRPSELRLSMGRRKDC